MLHVNLSYFTKQRQQSGPAATCSMAHTPACYPLYQWLYKKGGIGLLLFTAVFFVPYWLICELPMIIAAALGHVWQRFKGSRFTAPWLNLGNFLALLSLVMACMESPFTAVVFTYHYAKGMSYSFPALITNWGFVITVGSALLHIAWESWAVVLAIKAGRLKKSISAMFLGLLKGSTEADVEAKGVAIASNVPGDAELELGEACMRSKNVGVGGAGTEGPSSQDTDLGRCILRWAGVNGDSVKEAV